MSSWPNRRLGIAIAILFIASLTLSPAPGASSVPGAICLLCGDRGLADLTLNILLFLPLGVALAAGGGIRRAVLIGFALSALIEALQQFIPGRAPTYRDVVVNAFGCGLGAFSARYFADWLGRMRGRRFPVVLAALFPVLVVSAAGLLRAPYVAPLPLWGQWHPDLGNMEIWSGTVTAAAVGDLAVGVGAFERSDALRVGLGRADPVRITATAGRADDGLAPIFAVADTRSEHLLLIGQDHDDLIVQRFLRASLFRLDTPDERVVGLFKDIAPGTPFVLDVTSAAGRTCARLDERERCAERAGAMSVWGFFLWQSDAPRQLTGALAGLSAFVAFLPLGLLGGALRPRPALLTWILSGVGVALAASLSRFAAPGLLEASGAAFAFTLGRWAARRSHSGAHEAKDALH